MTEPEADAASDEAPEDEQHLERKHLYPLVWAHRDDEPPPKHGEGSDGELARFFEDLDERWKKDLPHEFRLGPETIKRLWTHAIERCDKCRMLLLEDGPSARAPKTKVEVKAAEQKLLDDRQKKLIKFWVDITVGVVAFGGAIAVINEIRSKEIQRDEAGALQADPRDIGKQIDPLWFAFFGAILVASWFLAEAYTIAKELWIDFTAWKRAVPVIGEWWVGKGGDGEGGEGGEGGAGGEAEGDGGSEES